jgi:predicted metalloprotease
MFSVVPGRWRAAVPETHPDYRRHVRGTLLGVEFDDDAVADVGAVEDRRGGGFGGRGLAIGGGGGLIGLIGLVLTLVLGGGGGGGLGVDAPGFDQVAQPPASSDIQGQSCKAGTGAQGRVDVFVVCAFNDIQATWRDLFTRAGEDYRPTTFVLYSGQTSTGCGVGSSAAGPFYCPADEKVYLDTSFFNELRTQLGAGGDFAQAYVVAHEVGHHVQNLLGTSDQVQQAIQKNSSKESDLSVRLELQADCYAGVWANAAQKAGSIKLDSTDVPEAINAAGQIGDDRLQKAAGRKVNPESFTHGTSEQRQRWLQRGIDAGDPASCDTFKGKP